MLVMNPGFFVPVYLLVAKVQYIFQTTDGYARFLIRRHKNKGRERLRVGELASGMAEAEDVGAASRSQFFARFMFFRLNNTIIRNLFVFLQQIS